MAKDPRIDTGSRARHPLPAEAQIKLRFDKFASFVTEYSSLVSRGGVFLKTDQLRPVGSEVSFDFRLVDGFRLFHGQGEVVWVRPAATGLDSPQGIGVRFAALDEKGRELVLKILEEQVKAGGEPFEIDLVPADATTDWHPTLSPTPGPALPSQPSLQTPLELGEEPTLISRPKGTDAPSFDAPWGERLPEIPTDLLDESEPPVNVPSVSSPDFAPPPRRSDPGSTTGLFTAAFPDQLTKANSPSQLGFVLDDAPTAPVRTVSQAPTPNPPAENWDAGRVTAPMFASEAPSWSFDPTEEELMLPVIEDPLVDLEDPPSEAFEEDLGDELPTMIGHRETLATDQSDFVFEPPGEDGELDEMVLPEPIPIQSALPSRDTPPPTKTVPPPQAEQTSPPPVATSPWEVATEEPPWKLDSAFAETAPIPRVNETAPWSPTVASDASPPVRVEPLLSTVRPIEPWAVAPLGPSASFLPASLPTATPASELGGAPGPASSIFGPPPESARSTVGPPGLERPLVSAAQYGAAAAWNAPTRAVIEPGTYAQESQDEQQESKPSFLKSTPGKLILAAAFLAVALGAGYYLMPIFQPPPTSDLANRPQPPRVRPIASDRDASTATPDAPIETPPVITLESSPPSPAIPSGEPSPPPESAAQEPATEPARESTYPPALPAVDEARYLDSVSIRDLGNRTEITLAFDAEISAARVEHDRMVWTDDREKVVVQGTGSRARASYSGQGNRVRAVRVGDHGASIWVVIDKDPASRVLSVTPIGRNLVVLVGS